MVKHMVEQNWITRQPEKETEEEEEAGASLFP
jgi:hypothetical protein